MSRLIIVGAGGFGRETLDVVESLAAQRGAAMMIAIVDDAPSASDLERLRVRNVAYIGTIDSWLQTTSGTDEHIIAVGAPATRQLLAERIDGCSRPAAPVVHPAATIGSVVSLAPGTVVCSGAKISTNVTMGAYAHINPGAIIGHDVILGDHVSINPGAIISGSVHVEDQVLVGAGATVLQGLTLGSGSTIGAAACVTRDVSAQTIVKGVPAR